MKASEFIKLIQDQIDKHGDLEISGGYLSEDRSPENFVAINSNGVDVNDEPDTKAVEFFIS